jgi:hypothetical protein
MMATMSTQFSLGVPVTDHDTDMLSDGAVPDIDIDIDLDEPSLTGDLDDYMAEGFEHEVNDDDMLVEDFDETRTNETADMFDGVVDEDDQMANIDFDEPEQFIAGTTDNSFVEELEIPDHVDAPEVQAIEEIVSYDTTQTQLISENTNNATIEAETTTQIQDVDTSSKSQDPEAPALSLPTETSSIHLSGTAAATTNRDSNPDDEEVITFEDDDETEAAPTATILRSEVNIEAEQTENILPQDEASNDHVHSEVREHDESQLDAHDLEEEQYDESADEDYSDYTYDVVVEYDNSRLSLFPPTHHHDIPETYLLQDRSLADQEISSLFSACREVLGASISEHQALEIDLPLLNLCIDEVST